MKKYEEFKPLVSPEEVPLLICEAVLPEMWYCDQLRAACCQLYDLNESCDYDASWIQTAIWNAGRIHGIRSERLRRKGANR